MTTSLRVHCVRTRLDHPHPSLDKPVDTSRGAQVQQKRLIDSCDVGTLLAIERVARELRRVDLENQMNFVLFAVVSVGLSFLTPFENRDRTGTASASPAMFQEHTSYRFEDNQQRTLKMAFFGGESAMHGFQSTRAGSTEGALILASDTLAVPTIEVPAQVQANEPIRVTIIDPEPGQKPWVTIVHEDAEPQSWAQYYYTDRRTSAEYEFRPLRPGAYEVRLHATEGSQAPVAVASFTVGEPIQEGGDAGDAQTTLEVPEQILVGEKIPVKVLDPKPGINPWVTVVREGAGPREYGAYYYTNGQTSAEFEFPDMQLGRYEVRLHAMDNSPGAIAVASVAVVASVDGSDEVSDAPGTMVVGRSGSRLIVPSQTPRFESIRVRVIDPEPGPSPWVTVVPKGAEGSAFDQQIFTHRQTSMKTWFKPLRNGEYEVRLHASEGSTTPIAMASMTVGPSGHWEIDPQDVQSRLVVPEEVPLGEKIRVEDVYPVPGQKPFVTVVPKGAPGGAWIQMLGRNANGPDVLEFDPLPPGEYEVRVHTDLNAPQALALATVSVVAPAEGLPEPPGYGVWDPDVPAASAAMIRLEVPPLVAPGQFVEVGFVHYFPQQDAWITVVEAGAPPDAGQQHHTRRTVSGTMRFNNLEPGDYEARYFPGGSSYVPLAVAPFTIGPE